MGNLWGYAILIPITILQSTLVHNIAIMGVKPDLILILLIYLANRDGKMGGQTYGFVSGIVEDFLSAAPLGFNGFLNTLLGFLFGLTTGSLFIDALFIPMVMAGTATLIKGVLISFLGTLFDLENLHFQFMSLSFLIEVGYNMLLAPFLFSIMRLLKWANPKKGW